MNNYLTSIFKRCLAALALSLVATTTISAFDIATYTENSRLASGKWVKISVPENGLYAIPAATLRQWGFADPSAVRVYGYGANRIPDLLTEALYVDDLPMAPSAYTTEQGLVFYGRGPESWVESSGRYYRQDLNIYTTEGYYYLSDTGEAFDDTPRIGIPEATSPCTFFIDRVFHEKELSAPGDAGYLLLGEDFRQQRTHNFEFDLVDLVENTPIWMETSAVAKLLNSTAQFSYTVNGASLPTIKADAITPTTVTAKHLGIESLAQRTFNVESGGKTKIGMTFSCTGTVHGAWLNYITLNYSRALRMADKSGSLMFYSDQARLQLSGVGGCSSLRVWDVTDPEGHYAVNTSAISSEGSTVWTMPNTKMRTYVAWSEKSRMPAPTFVGKVANQDLHAQQPVQMVIITLPEYTAQAERIANMHRNDKNYPLTVAVVNVDQVYNEFASGSPEVSALRKYLKMMYDRGLAAGEGQQLQYALLLGRSTFDHRRIASTVKILPFNHIPQWMGGSTRAQLNENDGFGTDDFIAMLEDGSGQNLGLDNLSIAVGRMPFRSVAEAKSYIDKLIQYNTKSPHDPWKNSIMLLADDEDNGIHMEQTEEMYNSLIATPDQQHVFNKVYMDAYSKSGGVYPGAREKMFHHLREGVVWWNFIGHANNHSWTHDGQLNYTDIMNMYLTHVPMLFAATCNFLKWDSPTLSGCEIMFNERYGGLISAISATRPVYITDNGYFISSMGRSLLKRDEKGQLRPIGEIYRTAKNNILNRDGLHTSNPNRLRYVLLGDPAMRLATPSNRVVVETIAGKPVDPNSDDQVILAAKQQADICGYVADIDGNPIPDFNGTVTASIFDAEHSVTSNGNGEGKPVSFDQMGEKLFTGSAQVVDGRFTLRVSMPSMVADNFRPATLNIYAHDTTTDAEAVGVNRDFYVYGYDETAPEDTEAPVIKTYILNHSSFKSGDTVNESPMVIAEVSDNVALNLAQTDLGHNMTLTLDDVKTFTTLNQFYTPSTDGTPSGVINYPIDNIEPGHHTLMLKIWDTSGNKAEQTIDFFVQKGLTPTIYDVLTDSNPASVEANFYLSHNRPNAMLTVQFTVYNLLGQPIWTNTTKGVSDMFLSTPVTWDLTDSAGRRVPRGIYLYRASVTADGESYDTVSRKIAVTAR